MACFDQFHQTPLQKNTDDDLFKRDMCTATSVSCKINNHRNSYVRSWSVCRCRLADLRNNQKEVIATLVGKSVDLAFLGYHSSLLIWICRHGSGSRQFFYSYDSLQH